MRSSKLYILPQAASATERIQACRPYVTRPDGHAARGVHQPFKTAPGPESRAFLEALSQTRFLIMTLPSVPTVLLIAVIKAITAQETGDLSIRVIPSIDDIAESPRDNLPALTTIFTPGSSCLSDLYVVARTWTGPWEVEGCHPAQTRTTYSPGLCYSGYEPALSQRNTFGGVVETVIHCCPL